MRLLLLLTAAAVDTSAALLLLRTAPRVPLRPQPPLPQRLRRLVACDAAYETSYWQGQPAYVPQRAPDVDASGGRGAIALSACGLLFTLFASATALSVAGVVATAAAGAAGLFAFKLAKELSDHGVTRGTMGRASKGALASASRVAVRLWYGIGRLVVYTLASLISLAVLLLTTAASAAATTASIAANLVTALRGAEDRLAAPPPYLGLGTSTQALPQAPEELPVPPVEAELDQRPPFSIGQQLAVEQMLQRSASAAAAARRVESERATVLQRKQEEAVAKALRDSRMARVAQVREQSSTTPKLSPPSSLSPASAPPSFRPSPLAPPSAASNLPYSARRPPPPRPPPAAPPPGRGPATTSHMRSAHFDFKPSATSATATPAPPAPPAPSASSATGAASAAAAPMPTPAANLADSLRSRFAPPPPPQKPSLAEMARKQAQQSKSATGRFVPPAAGGSSKLDVPLAARAKEAAGGSNPWLPRGYGAGATAPPSAPAPAPPTSGSSAPGSGGNANRWLPRSSTLGSASPPPPPAL